MCDGLSLTFRKSQEIGQGNDRRHLFRVLEAAALLGWERAHVRVL